VVAEYSVDLCGLTSVVHHVKLHGEVTLIVYRRERTGVRWLHSVDLLDRVGAVLGTEHFLMVHLLMSA
jgi:hypothetical protein